MIMIKYERLNHIRILKRQGDCIMAFTLQIRQKKLFGKTILDIPSLAQACGLCYGSNNDFYILQENEQVNGTAVFYHPEHIGQIGRAHV